MRPRIETSRFAPLSGRLQTRGRSASGACSRRIPVAKHRASSRFTMCSCSAVNVVTSCRGRLEVSGREWERYGRLIPPGFRRLSDWLWVAPSARNPSIARSLPRLSMMFYGGCGAHWHTCCFTTLSTFLKVSSTMNRRPGLRLWPRVSVWLWCVTFQNESFEA